MSSALLPTPDIRTSTPALALVLTDGFTGGTQLAGGIQIVPKPYAQNSGKYVFLNLPAGASTVAVSSNQQPPLYQPAKIQVTIPPPNPKSPVVSATLSPTTSYPFPPTATLVRGYVLSNNAPVPGAVVSAPGAPMNYTTAADGEYVLFFASITGVSQSITVTATPPRGPAKSVAVQVQRGTTVSQPITL
jgi:hypothetical protein